MKIDDIGMKGEGIAHVNGKAVFVPFALPDEEYSEGEITNPSKFRRTAACPYFYSCGGCDIQHMARDFALKFKQRKIENLLAKFKLQVDVSNCVSGENEFYYRNKLTLQCDGNNFGLYKKNSKILEKIEFCQICSKEINIAIKIILQTLNPRDVDNIILHSQNNQILISIFLNKNLKIKENFFKFEEKIKKNYQKYGILIYFNKKLIKILGEKELTKNEFGVLYPFSNESFYQVNDEVKNLIYTQILNEISPDDQVIDAYSGAGLLSAIIAKKCQKITAIEIVKEATKNANKLKKLNKISNLFNINGDTAKVIPSLDVKNSVVILDPPRAGCSASVINVLNSELPKKIIYLSCNPATLIRDLKLLSEKFAIEKLIPYDMFPQTHHVETLAILSLKS